ncbi:unnamed protein product [Leptosia nina]|uniref:Uncharacterized protein n=1 Tax=Leptosia nina TaxID=320188 RepID=A0AAV1JYW7_9NEOP
MKELLDRRKARWHRPSYGYSTEVLNQESDVETTTKYFIDLTRSSEDRLDHGFAYDYADFFEMARTSDKTKKSFYPPSKYRRYGDDYITKKILRTNFYSDSESDSRKGRWSDSSEASDEVVKPKRGRKDPFNYMQAPTRIYEIELDLRRRLPHFLPKRHHWDEEDFKNLRNYWIHGPQGKYPGPYRIPY